MNNSNLTPMMRQYVDTKKEFPEGILLFRAGDFYEMFYDDAKTASKILNITLTKRGKGETEAPLAGIPYHSIDPYITKLIRAGKKVVICEQIEDPKKAKGLVKRAVTRVITPSTLFTDNFENNFLCSICKLKNSFAFSIIDITTGEFKCGKVDTFENLLDELILIKPKELLLTKNLLKNYKYIDLIKKYLDKIIINYSENLDLDYSYKKLQTHFNLKSLEAFGIQNDSEKIISCCNALDYIKKTQFSNITYIKNIKEYNCNNYLKLDRKTVRNLELVSNLKDNSIKNSLFYLINKTKTAMGYRNLYFNLLHPITNKKKLDLIYESVEEISKDVFLLEELKNNLAYIGDIDKIISKIGFGNANPRDLIALKQSLVIIPEIKNAIRNCNSNYLKDIYSNLTDLKVVSKLIEDSIVENPPFSVREGKFIKPSYSSELYELTNISKNINNWICEYEAKLKFETNIKSLKLKFNKIFGYYIEIPRSLSSQVPDYFERKQTLINSERFTTTELNEKEKIVLNAKDKRIELEFNLFIDICNTIMKYQTDIQEISKLVGILDTYFSFAKCANDFDYTKPIITNNSQLEITDLRHPIIEQIVSFIPNDCKLDSNNCKSMIITGPNMAGKSSYMRSVCLCVILAYAGSFVPAKLAKIGFIDGVFTRVGASDDILHGQSTFLVEMSEVAYILNNTTKNSLVILDEVGRGTSTYDGISLAWAIIENLNNVVQCKTLIATHYHTLNKMQEVYTGIHNYHVTAKEEDDGLHFYHKLKEGGINKSYGIQVAKLAGIKKNVVDRALIIQRDLENDSFLKKSPSLIKSSESIVSIDSELEPKPKKINDLNQKNLSEY